MQIHNLWMILVSGALCMVYYVLLHSLILYDEDEGMVKRGHIFEKTL